MKVFKIRCVEIKATYDVDIYWPNPTDGLLSISDTIWKVNLSDFQQTGALNETCTRKAVADIFRPVTQHYKLGLTLDRYPQCTTDVTPTTTLSGHGDPITESGWSPVFTIADHSSIYKHEWPLTLVFKVGGIESDASQPISNMADFMIYDDYLCPQSEFTRTRLSHVCYWGFGGTHVTKTDIPQKIQENCWLNFVEGVWVDPWSLETQAGDCRPHSGLIQRALEVLGISADGVTSEGDCTCRVGETRWCDQHQVNEWHYFHTIMGGDPWNFEAVCNVLLIDEASPYNCYYDKAMGEDPETHEYQAGTYAQMWTEWNDYPPPNYKVIHHYTTWENH